MKRAEAKVIGTPLFEFYKRSHNLHNIYAAQYLLYGVLCNQNLVIKATQIKLIYWSFNSLFDTAENYGMVYEKLQEISSGYIINWYL